MHTYQYQPGDTPLEGYTIKSAAGHGGFGEVYYAVSDAGREVALKAVQGYEQIELRGIRQCMNLKNPHLVTIFDVKHNAKGQPFVLMEYVAGPSLRDLIDESPGGLGPEKTAFFLREIAKGLSYLHDCGIVHRDLKPANIFYENGYVKIGDYGLSKAISADHHQSQTVTVGTVHYMAPEVGAGKYDRSIDIYAMGVVVYEMLTGQVPFKGASPSEVLMKHLSSNPELDAIEEPFKQAIQKAMAKDPAKRYQSVNEMVQTVFGEERMKQSMASFSQADLSMAAAHVGAKVRGGGGGAAVGVATESDGPRNDVTDRIEHAAQQVQRSIDHASRRIDEKLGGRRVKSKRGGVADAARDPMRPGQRWTLAAISLFLVTTGAGYLSSGHALGPAALFAAGAGLGAVLGLMIARSRFMPALKDESWVLKRLVVGGTAALFAVLLSLPLGHDSSGLREQLNFTLFTLHVPLFLMDWSKVMLPGRAERLSFGSAIMAGLLGWLTSWFVNDASAILAIGIPAAVMLATQALSPFDPTTTEDWAVDEDERPLPAPGPIRRDAHAQPDHTRLDRNAVHKTEKVNAYSNVVTHHDSPRSRLIALLVAVAPFVTGIPIFGIHRFYAGKVGTGILWLLTGGICGVGQIIDIILIACGAFKDAEGRPVKDWNPNERREGKARNSHTGSNTLVPPQRVSYGPGPFSILLSMLASILILTGVAAGTMLILQVPEMISADVLDIGLNRELDGIFGYQEWPNLLHAVGGIGALLLILTGGAMLIFARRANGPLHMMRVLFGLFMLLPAAMIGLKKLIDTDDPVNRLWLPMAEEMKAQRVGPAIDIFLRHIDAPAAILVLMFVLGAVVLLAWPPTWDQALTGSSGKEGV